ncbi:MAG: 30S ribosomal protein S16 [Deltaproteobacteria bacterium]|jgi:small subunit ribosomal protein S16|nr:30S ribosomal protein S16 [Deltaproteobacteria bacterium]
MAVKIRLSRHGSKKRPFYRIVVTDSIYPRDGRFLETLGTYDPRNKISGIRMDKEAIQTWINKGAQVTNTVKRIIKTINQPNPAA